MYQTARPDACAAAPARPEPAVGEELICRPAQGGAEREAAFAIRHAVFVEEQRIFLESDRDPLDESAVLLVAEKEGRIVGTVRLHPEAGGRWRGSRLAVLPGSRGRIGAALVEAAVVFTARSGAELLVADVQKSCLGLFLKLGWEAVGPGPLIGGVPHVHVRINPAARRGAGEP